MATWRPLIGFRLLRAVPAHMIWVAGDGKDKKLRTLVAIC